MFHLRQSALHVILKVHRRPDASQDADGGGPVRARRFVCAGAWSRVLWGQQIAGWGLAIHRPTGSTPVASTFGRVKRSQVLLAERCPEGSTPSASMSLGCRCDTVSSTGKTAYGAVFCALRNSRTLLRDLMTQVVG